MADERNGVRTADLCPRGAYCHKTNRRRARVPENVKGDFPHKSLAHKNTSPSTTFPPAGGGNKTCAEAWRT
jgi:hypothetical protein